MLVLNEDFLLPLAVFMGYGFLLITKPFGNVLDRWKSYAKKVRIHALALEEDSLGQTVGNRMYPLA